MFLKTKKHSIILAVFAVIATGLLAIVNSLTINNIKQKLIQKQVQLLNEVIPQDLYNNKLLDECYCINNLTLGDNLIHHLYLARKNGVPIAAIIEIVAPDGYAGAINLLVGADFSGNVLGVRVLHHNETPGLGDKIELRVSNWIMHFNGKSLHSDHDISWKVKKDGGMFDEFTGATITPRAVVNAVKNAVSFLKKKSNILEKLPHCKKMLNE